MNEKSKVSVIVPVYNAEKYVGETIESVLNQSYANVELILIDDGSKDNSGKVCDEYAGKYKEIVLVHQENAGSGKAKNEGLKLVHGKYIVFLDCDDVLEKDAISNLIHRAEETGADMVMPDRYYCIDEESEILGTKFHFREELCLEDPTAFALKVMMGAGRGWRTHSLLLRTDRIMENHILFSNGTVDDYFFNLECMKHFDKLAYIKKETVYYRTRKNSVTSSFHENFMELIWRFDEAALKFIREKNISREEADKYESAVVIRTVITYIGDIFSSKASMKWKERVQRAKVIIDDSRVHDKFKGNFHNVYFTKKMAVYYYKVMHKLVRWRMHCLIYVLAYISERGR